MHNAFWLLSYPSSSIFFPPCQSLFSSLQVFLSLILFCDPLEFNQGCLCDLRFGATQWRLVCSPAGKPQKTVNAPPPESTSVQQFSRAPPQSRIDWCQAQSCAGQWKQPQQIVIAVSCPVGKEAYPRLSQSLNERTKGTLILFPSPGPDLAMAALWLGTGSQGVKVLVPGSLPFPHWMD